MKRYFFVMFIILNLLIFGACTKRKLLSGPTPEETSPIAITVAPVSTEELINKGKNFKTNREFKSAIDTFEQVVDRVPDHLEANILLAETRNQMGEHERALEIINRLLEKNPQNTRILRKKVELLESQNKFEECVGMLEKIEEIEGESYGTTHQLADCYEKAGNLEKARDYYRKNIENYPTQYEGYKALADFWLFRARQTEKPDEKAEFYQNAADVLYKGYKITDPGDALQDKPGKLFLVANIYLQKWE
ncbi:MAG: tetratricopeptide repeat protein, partial [Vulcanimicrobiota bacterium]